VRSVSFHFDVPMLVTDVGGLRETVASTGCGRICGSCTPEAVASEIQNYFADPAIGQECKKNIQIQKGRLGWDVFARLLIEFAGKL